LLSSVFKTGSKLIDDKALKETAVFIGLRPKLYVRKLRKSTCHSAVKKLDLIDDNPLPAFPQKWQHYPLQFTGVGLELRKGLPLQQVNYKRILVSKELTDECAFPCSTRAK
jgi:hypothetical protein